MDALDAFSSSDFTMKFATASNCDIGWVSKDGLIISLPWNSGYGAQIAIDDNFNWMGFRSKSNGTWNNWSVLLSSTNYTSYVTPTNIGAAPSSHTHTKSQITDFPSSLPASDVYAWAKASSKPSYSWDEITAKPSSFTPASHTHTSVNNITPEWSGSVAWADTGWIAAWNSDGTKIKALDKNSFAPASHTHSYLPLSGGTVTGETQFNNYLKLNAWPGYGTGTANFWYDANNKFVEIQNATDLKLSGTKVSKDGHTHNYAGSSSAGGSATSAVKLDSSAGSATQPIYFSDGKPVSCAYSLGKSVPSDAVFTDTVYTHPTTAGNKHIPSGGSSGQILRWSADGTAVWGDDNNAELNNKTSVTIVRWS